jgi:hypothetical protein
MLRKIGCIIVLFSLFATASAQELPPQPTSIDGPPSDPELSGLVWHPTKTENFIILSIESKQGEYFVKNIESMKTSCLTKWGLTDIKFSSECKIVCVPNKSLLKKLFGLNGNYAEIRRDVDGRVKMSAIWLSYDDSADVILPYLSLVSLKEYEQVKKVKLGNWFSRGAVFLNFNIGQVKSKLSGMKADLVTSKNVLDMNEDDWKKLDNAAKEQYDLHAACACLLLRKELGQENLLKFITKNGDADLFEVYGYKKGEFSDVLQRYINHLGNDLSHDRTPDKYITIYPAEQ